MGWRDDDRRQRDYETDVFYDVWRSGGDPDRIDYDRVRDSYRDGVDHDAAADRELHAMRPQQRPMDEQEWLEEQYEEEPEECE